jgi:selenoprotein W-related protein
MTLKPSDGGRFEITVDGKVLFSKLETDRFPEEDEVLELVASEIGAK